MIKLFKNLSQRPCWCNTGKWDKDIQIEEKSRCRWRLKTILKTILLNFLVFDEILASLFDLWTLSLVKMPNIFRTFLEKMTKVHPARAKKDKMSTLSEPFLEAEIGLLESGTFPYLFCPSAPPGKPFLYRFKNIYGKKPNGTHQTH